MGALFAGSATAAPPPGTLPELAEDLTGDENSPVMQNNQCDVVYALTFLLNNRGLNAAGEPVADIASAVCGG